ncbi:monocarboxylate transporter, partial [Lasius niger]
MNERADSASLPCEEAAYRKRRRSYSAAMSEENSLDEDDDDEPEEEESYPHRDGATRARCCRLRECSARKISNPESESGCSTESLVSKRTRESSGDIAKSWSEIEIPELLLAHPEILSRMMRCRCFVSQFSACRCRCAQCQYQRRKISSTSSCFAKEPALLLQGVGAKRKDSGNSVSTCQSFLPPSSGRNSAGSLYPCCNDTGDNGTMTTTIQRRHSIAAGPIPYRRYLDQTHTLRTCKIDRADNRELSEQSLAGDTIRNCESITGATSIAEPIIASKTRPRASLKTTTARATQSLATFHRDNSASADIKAPKDNESRFAGKSFARLTTGGKNAEANADAAFTARKSSAIPITPKMMRRRFSEQLILEGGLGSVGESENLIDQPEDVDDSLTARNARKKITLKKHYYPEGGWGCVIVIVTILVHIVSHGLQLAFGLLISPTMTQFQQTVENA